MNDSGHTDGGKRPGDGSAGIPTRATGDADLTADAAAARAAGLGTPVLDLVADFVLITNPERKVVFINEATSTRFGITRDEAIGLPPGNVIGCAVALDSSVECGVDDVCAPCGLGRVIAGAEREGSAFGTTRIRLAYGQTMDVDVRATRLSQDGRTYVLSITRDRSKEHWQRQLDRSFFHDLLNVATGISGLSELASTAPGCEADEDVATLSRLGKELVEMIRRQQTLEAPTSGDLDTDFERVDVAQVVTAAVDVNSAAASKRFVSIERRLDLPNRIETDRWILGRVLANLIRNAIEASSAGDSVRIETEVTGGHVGISVHNEAWISPETQPAIFRRAFSTKGNERGIGTFSARLLTERYLGGSIRFETDPQSGTTFTVTLPLDRPGPVEPDPGIAE